MVASKELTTPLFGVSVRSILQFAQRSLLPHPHPRSFVAMKATFYVLLSSWIIRVKHPYARTQRETQWRLTAEEVGRIMCPVAVKN